MCGLSQDVAMFADSHVHLADIAFADDVDSVVERARAAGARVLVCIGESPAAALRAQVIASRYPGFVFHTCGVHPHDAASWQTARDSEAIHHAIDSGAVAIGECGLDYHYENAPRALQRSVLACQLHLADERQVPIILHTRNAEDDTRQFLRDAGVLGVRGVLHCFTGSIELARAALDVGWYVSFSGIITFRTWSDIPLLRHIPDDRLLVESDAPYLAPIPFRGKRNESAHVTATLTRLATARETSVAALGATTLANTRRFFDLPDAPTFPNTSC